MGAGESKAAAAAAKPIASPYLYPEHTQALLTLFRARLAPPAPAPSPSPPFHASFASFNAFLALPPELHDFTRRFYLALARGLPPPSPTHSTPTQKSHSHRRHDNKHNSDNHSVTTAPQNEELLLTPRAFVESLGIVLRGPPREQLLFLFEVYSHEGVLSETDLRALLTDAYRLSLRNIAQFLESDPLEDPDFSGHENETISAFLTDSPSLPCDKYHFTDFATSKFPNLPKVFESFASQTFLNSMDKAVSTPDTASETAKASVFPPALLLQTPSAFPSPLRLSWALSLFTDVSNPMWTILYSNFHHGRSFNRLTSQIFGYGGPTLLLIRTPKNEVFGAYVTVPWQSRAVFREDYSAFLFSVLPRVSVFRTSGVDANHVYLYNVHKPQIKLPNGIGFGGQLQAESYRLWIDESLDFGTCRSIDSSFTHGAVCPSMRFEIDIIEVWGCGGTQAELEQAQAKNRENRIIDKSRKVNRQMAANGGNDWTMGPDKFMMDLVGKTGQADAFLDEVSKIKEARQEAAASSSQPQSDD